LLRVYVDHSPIFHYWAYTTLTRRPGDLNPKVGGGNLRLI